MGGQDKLGRKKSGKFRILDTEQDQQQFANIVEWLHKDVKMYTFFAERPSPTFPFIEDIDVLSADSEAGVLRKWTGGSWDEMSKDAGDGMPGWLAAKVRQLRPVVETGYENTLLMRLCVEEALSAEVNARARELADERAEGEHRRRSHNAETEEL